MTPEQVSELYAKLYGTPEFPHLVVSMSVDPLLVLSLADLNGVNKWKDLIGPDKQVQAEWFYPVSMRKRFGLREPIPDGLHASGTLNDSSKENRYFFSESKFKRLINYYIYTYSFYPVVVTTSVNINLSQSYRQI